MHKIVNLAWLEQIKNESTSWGADTFPPLTTEWTFVSPSLYMQKLQITKITTPAALDLCFCWDFFYSAHVSLCSVCCVYMNQIATLIIFWLHFITGENYSDFFLSFFALMHKKRALPPPWLRKWFKRASERRNCKL